ncbi:STAS domain-containing protein [Microbispora sp. NPDC049125]|uniref:STAS domain-containing protein n=1 Tax=Microbispora sp. NPDC049125 TaxID=3154929 RepID=UPI003466A165
MTEHTDPAERFTVSIGVREGVIVASASGELDYHHAGRFQERISEAWETLRSPALILNMAAVAFCDSMGIGVLVLLRNRSREQGRLLVLSALPAHLERVLTLTGLRGAFLIEPSVEDAIRSVAGSSGTQ